MLSFATKLIFSCYKNDKYIYLDIFNMCVYLYDLFHKFKSIESLQKSRLNISQYVFEFAIV